jgi:hypothetical protein
MRADLRVIGPAASFGRYVVSGGTAIVAGEPLHSLGTATAGEVNVNTYVLAAVDTGIIGTHAFGGIALKDSDNVAAGTTKTQYLTTANPVPSVGRIRGKALTASEVDTAAELAGVIGDHTLIDYNSTGGSDGGELYTIISNATANTSAFTIVGGNTALAELEVVIDDRGYRCVVA